LDRDGVINEDFGYVHRPEDTVFIPGIFDLVRASNSYGYKVVVVTNQAGIGRGYYTETDFNEYMNWQKEQFLKRGARIDAVYYCPHHPLYGVGKFKVSCNCRKPMPGMLARAAEEVGIDISGSLMVGDKESDLLAGINAGLVINQCFKISSPADFHVIATHLQC
jgi:D-glycero-D-manno-heptose 1,7-bisphosphate phosphatase